jgi:hypothetical protein
MYRKMFYDTEDAKVTFRIRIEPDDRIMLEEVSTGQCVGMLMGIGK